MSASRRLHPLPLVAGIAIAVLTLQLGNWQTRRAAEKEAVQAAFLVASAGAPQALGERDPAEWENVELAGEWMEQGTILLDNRVYRGRAGYQVVTPLRLGGAQPWVLVNRGWVAASADRARLPALTTPAGVIVVRGRVRHAPPKGFTLEQAGTAPVGPVWQRLDFARYREWRGADVAGFYVEQTGVAADGLVRDWPAPAAGVERHRGYAFQWYSLAVLAVVLTVAYVCKVLWRKTGERHHYR